MKSTSTPTTVKEIVEDIIAKLVNTSEAILAIFHHRLGTYIRTHYDLWENQALVKATGKEHPDDASMVIIKAVWQALYDSAEKGN